MKSDKSQEIEERKKDHIDICLNSDVAFKKSNGFERYEFIHNSLTEVDIEKIDFKTKFLSKKISLPFLISSMTGGSKETVLLNEKLAVVAHELNIPIGVGSMRAILEDESEIKSFTVVRKEAPDVPVLSNIGAAQLVELSDLSNLKKIIEPLEADGLIIHLNPLQELLQKEGDRNFSGILNKIEKTKTILNIPIIVKEVGSGIDGIVAQKLIDVGVDIIDVAGSGGTSWAAVEIIRNDDESNYFFRDWGFRTSYCLRSINKLNDRNKIKLIGSGGISNFSDAAKAFALGADLVASAGTILKQLDAHGTKGVIEFIIKLFVGIKKIMFLTGSSTLLELRDNKIIFKEDNY